MNNFLQSLSQALNNLVQYLPISVGFIILLFMIHIVNVILGRKLNLLGIWPRKKFGWIGIPFSPFLHANFTHLILNAIPLFIFSNFILLQGLHLYLTVTVYIIILSGILIWIFGRPGIHIGASSLIMGYLGFIVIGIYYHPTPFSIIIGIVTILYFSAMFSNLFPSSDKQVSWEGHVLGFLSGIAVAYLIGYLPVI